MGEKVIVGPFNRGLRNDVTSFNVDNDSFPVLINAYQWRGRIKRKRGTELLGRLQRFFNSTSASYNSGTTTITLDGSGNGNLLNNASWNLEANAPDATIVPGTVTITSTVTLVVYTDPSKNGTLSPSGSINYATGEITIAAEAGNTVTAKFVYNPNLPVMGLRDFVGISNQFPGTLGFDTSYSYNINTTFPYPIYDISFYKNPVTGTYPSYVQKSVVTPTSWNGQNYQQFYTVNYQGALWATNGVTNPFVNTNIGMQYKNITTVTVTSGGPPAIVSLNINAHGLVVGDFLFINEVQTTIGINWQTGYVITVTDANNVVVEFPNATIATNGTGGIAQYLTNRSDPTRDCIRWYDGDPTNGSVTNPVLSGHLGWVNYCPPLSQAVFSIADLPAAIYYLVGAKVIFPFKDRLLFFGPVVQTSSANSQVFLQDTIIYTQNGTPYYTCSYTNTPSATVDNPTSVTNVFHPILVPTNQIATSPALFADSTGFGGNITAGIDQLIATVAPNEDVLIVGFQRSQARLIYSGSDIVPFNLFIINSELGNDSTFSAVVMDKGVFSIGSRGIVVTSQVESSRIDLEIPDAVFELQELNNGTQRICAQRDYINEWIYFTTGRSNSSAIFPTQTLQYNYRDQSWAQFLETYTSYGLFRKQTGFTWATNPFETWNSWNEPWDAGSASLLKPLVIGGNQQGFVLFRDQGTEEDPSLFISNFVGNTVTSPNHCLNNGDYISFTGVIGNPAGVNGIPFQITVIDNDNFIIGPNVPPSFTYIGSGEIIRYYTPFIQTKQFPIAWAMGRKTRIGAQQYLLTTTAKSQITLLIYLSQDASFPYNNIEFPVPVAIVPDPNSMNNTLVYSTVLYTCPESINLGLTPANTNLQMLTAQTQQQIWHRINTSLIGDTVQLGFTMNSAQMLDSELIDQVAEVELHGFIIDVNPSQMLA